MNVKNIGISLVPAFVISYIIWVFFSLAIGQWLFVSILMYFAVFSVVSLLSSVFGTLQLLKEKPPFREKAEEMKARMRAGRQEEREKQTEEIKGRLEQLIAQGKDPFETGIQNLDKITKKPGTEKKIKAQKKTGTAKKPTTPKKTQNQKK